jgi:hypothetical protein
MSVSNAGIYKATSVRVIGADVINSRNITPEARKQATVKILNHWCRKCGTYMTNADGLCAKCRQPLAEEYKAKLNAPVKIGLAASLHAQGYEPHTNPIDRDAIMDTRCKLCAGACYYIGLKKGSSYKAISRCVKCGNEIEI